MSWNITADARHRGLGTARANPLERLESRTLFTAVTAVSINGIDVATPGGQRSVINTISMKFDSNVDGHADTHDLVLWNLNTNEQVSMAPPVTVAYEVGTNTATWSFPATSFANGNYRATLKSMTVFDNLGRPLDGDGDGVPGDEYNFEFHRFFGDSDGDRDVDTRDYARLRATRRMGAAAPAPLKATFDFDGDGDVDARDQAQFRRNLTRRLRPYAGNRPPAAPVINEPAADGQLIDAQDLHMQVEQAFIDPDSPAADPTGQGRAATDWEVWTRNTTTPERVFRVTGATQFDSKVHVHFGDGAFEGSHAGRTTLLPERDYLLRVRHHDASGNAGTGASNWDVRLFRTLPSEPSTAPGWVAQQPGFRVEELPFEFNTGDGDWRLPVNIAFVPEHLRRPDPGAPFFYVNELYGRIRVVTNDYHVHTYAAGLLNYDPSGPFGGSGENGVTGLVVDPSNGDVYATMLYDEPTDTTGDTFGKVTRYTSANGGITAVDTSATLAGTQGTDILKLPGEPMRQSHIISNISFGPDDKLFVHVGDGFSQTRGQNDARFGGKVLRINRNGTPATDNPHYNAGNGITPLDYWYAKGLRNPFGGGWRDADPSAGRPAQHFIAENGPSRDRLTMLVRDRNYLYDGSDASMNNFNIAWSPTGTFENGAPDWEPSPAPVNMTFVQGSAFNGSHFPASKQGHAFVALSGSTHGLGASSRGDSIQEWVLYNDGTRRVSAANEPPNPRLLVRYGGTGYSTAAAIAAGPNGLYFSTLYPEVNPDATAPGAKVLRVVYVGVADFGVSPASGPAPLSVTFTDRSDVPAATTYLWDFGDGTTSHEQNPTHTYAATGRYTVKLVVTGVNGDVEVTRSNVVNATAPAAPLVAAAAEVVPVRDPFRPVKRTGATALLSGE